MDFWILSCSFQIFTAFLLCLIDTGQGYKILAHWSLNGTEQGLTLHGGPTFVEGRYPGSKAINFNQSSSCFARIPKVELRSRSFTIALWIIVKALRSKGQVFFSDFYSPTWNFHLAILPNRAFAFKRVTSAGTRFYLDSSSTNSLVNVGSWHHMAVVWDQSGGTVKLYIDANEVSSKAFNTSTTWQPARSTFEIGDDGQTAQEHQFLGSVMDLYIIEGALDSIQIEYVKGWPNIATSYHNNTFVYTNERIQCQAKGSPTPFVTWVRSGLVLVNKTSSAEITIAENNGEYMCVASNREGTENITVKAKAALQLCHDYNTISDVSRAVDHFYQSSQFKTENTDNDLSKWYRIQSLAGNQLPTTCVPQNRCGAQAPGWLNGPYPSIQDGIVKRTVCFHLNGDCCYQNTTVHIRKCYGYYVYKFSGVPKGLTARYCIENKMFTTEDQPDSMFQERRGREGLSHTGHVMYTEEGVADVYTCLNYCQLFNGCTSLKFSEEKKICQLHNASLREQPDASNNNNLSRYFEKMKLVAINGL